MFLLLLFVADLGIHCLGDHSGQYVDHRCSDLRIEVLP